VIIVGAIAATVTPFAPTPENVMSPVPSVEAFGVLPAVEATCTSSQSVFTCVDESTITGTVGFVLAWPLLTSIADQPTSWLPDESLPRFAIDTPETAPVLFVQKR